MPLRCIDPTNNRSILAFDLSEAEWDALVARNRRDYFLRMACCAAEVVLRKSHQGTPHFVHKVRPERCFGGGDPETEHHRRLKALSVERARLAGWEADCEVGGRTPNGDWWIADVLARKNGRTIAIEIQWSPQTHEETCRRQRRYADSGVRCLWMMRDTGPLGFDDKHVPVAGVLVDQEIHKGYLVSLGDESTMNATSFLDALFGGRFKFGRPGGSPRLDETAIVELWAAPAECWNERCRAPMDVLLEIAVTSGNKAVKIKAGLPYWYKNTDITRLGEAALETLNPLLLELGMGEVKPRNFHAEGYGYDPKVVPASNGCPKCDRIFSCFEKNRSALESQRKMAGSFIVASAPWRDVLVEDAPHPRAWHVVEDPSITA